LTNTEAGERFKEVVHVALARSHTVHTMAELIRCTGLHQNTLYDIFNGTTKDGPGPRTVNLIADCLDIPTRHLWDAWQGREPEPDSAEEALLRHADAVDQQNRLLGELVGFIRSAAAAVVEPLPDPSEEAEAQRRAAEAESDPDPEGGGASVKRSVPHGKAG
jgi:lambda repressor-like predicted transcriptional regulator